MAIKLGVRQNGKQARSRHWSPEILFAVQVAYSVYQDNGERDLIITCGVDGTHMASSKHYRGDGFDAKKPTIPQANPAKVLSELRAALGVDYDVVDEPSHYHVEFQPKDPLNA